MVGKVVVDGEQNFGGEARLKLCRFSAYKQARIGKITSTRGQEENVLFG